MSAHPAALLRSDTEDVCLNLFGGPYATSSGRRVDVPEGSKRLLAFVALSDGTVERRRAAGVIWPTNDDVRAAGNLRSALWRLRGAGINLLEADKTSLWLRPGTLVDVDILHKWATRLICGCPRAADLHLTRWHTDSLELLPGWYDDWALFERERIRQQLLHALEALARHLIADGRRAEAVEVAMTAVAIEPLRETAQQVLVETHLAEGNLVEGRRAYRTYRALVLRELGVEPGARLTRLIESHENNGVPINRGLRALNEQVAPRPVRNAAASRL
jgi:DNA-binding SARP family transcriptional activator